MNEAIITARYLCIGCPLGCRLEVDESPSGDIVEIRGFSCKRGKEYAQQEHSDPRRMVTTTVAIANAPWPRLPVKSSAPVPKARVIEICRLLRSLQVNAPVQAGDVLVANVLGLGADIVATRSFEITIDLEERNH